MGRIESDEPDRPCTESPYTESSLRQLIDKEIDAGSELLFGSGDAAPHSRHLNDPTPRCNRASALTGVCC